MEELKWSKGENMVKCRGDKINVHGGYFKDFSNTTINVLFQTVVKIIETRQGVDDAMTYT